MNRARRDDSDEPTFAAMLGMLLLAPVWIPLALVGAVLFLLLFLLLLIPLELERQQLRCPDCGTRRKVQVDYGGAEIPVVEDGANPELYTEVAVGELRCASCGRRLSLLVVSR